jgi:hypothetical protein
MFFLANLGHPLLHLAEKHGITLQVVADVDQFVSLGEGTAKAQDEKREEYQYFFSHSGIFISNGKNTHFSVITALFRWLSVAFPENPVGITLDVWIRIGYEETFGSPETVFAINFDTAKVATKFLGDNGGGTAARERVKDTVTWF